MIEEDEAEAHQVDMESDLGSAARSCSWTNDFSCDVVNADLSLNLSIFQVDSDRAPSPSCRRRMMVLDAGGFHDLTGAALRKTKASSRRNAWGNQSYAELITRAIESTPDKRLTLSQIYDWMVRYVPYFKDKGDSNSSAGWKVSCCMIHACIQAHFSYVGQVTLACGFSPKKKKIITTSIISYNNVEHIGLYVYAQYVKYKYNKLK